MTEEKSLLYGRMFTEEELEDVYYIVNQFTHLSRTELAKTVCEGIDWKAPNGKYKIDAGRKLLEHLESKGKITLPEKKNTHPNPNQSYTQFAPEEQTNLGEELNGSVADYAPIYLEAARSQEDMHRWNGYVERYHMLGYKRPFGAHQRYFIYSGAEPSKPLGCMLFSASAWALAKRDAWIGWSKEERSQHLSLVVNNTRFLIFPWVKIRNLASKALSLATKQVPIDWKERYGFKPVLLETFVDAEQFRGTSYQAANWIHVGKTAGRGRMDRYNEKLSSVKHIYMYPLRKDFRTSLSGEGEEAK